MNRIGRAVTPLCVAIGLSAGCVPDERSFEGTHVTLVSADAALVGAVQRALAAAGMVVGEIGVTVANGTVALRGEVSSPAERTAAEAAARGVEGVQDVRNEISVISEPSVSANAERFDLRLFAWR